MKYYFNDSEGCRSQTAELRTVDEVVGTVTTDKVVAQQLQHKHNK